MENLSGAPWRGSRRPGVDPGVRGAAPQREPAAHVAERTPQAAPERRPVVARPVRGPVRPAGGEDAKARRGDHPPQAGRVGHRPERPVGDDQLGEGPAPQAVGAGDHRLVEDQLAVEHEAQGREPRVRDREDGGAACRRRQSPSDRARRLPARRRRRWSARPPSRARRRRRERPALPPRARPRPARAAGAGPEGRRGRGRRRRGRPPRRLRVAPCKRHGSRPGCRRPGSASRQAIGAGQAGDDRAQVALARVGMPPGSSIVWYQRRRWISAGSKPVYATSAGTSSSLTSTRPSSRSTSLRSSVPAPKCWVDSAPLATPRARHSRGPAPS
jgi:hypothetical protein